MRALGDAAVRVDINSHRVNQIQQLQQQQTRKQR